VKVSGATPVDVPVGAAAPNADDAGMTEGTPPVAPNPGEAGMTEGAPPVAPAAGTAGDPDSDPDPGPQLEAGVV
jgi:hypothetical protein